MENTAKREISITERIDDALRNPEIITKAIIKAAKIAGRKHKQAGIPIVEGRDGKVVIIPASEIPDETPE
jgi:hypothetical protein